MSSSEGRGSRSFSKRQAEFFGMPGANPPTLELSWRVGFRRTAKACGALRKRAKPKPDTQSFSAAERAGLPVRRNHPAPAKKQPRTEGGQEHRFALLHRLCSGVMQCVVESSAAH